ncbi:MAG: hypothetical protein K0Q57_439 [Gammaproteobacteria bacterium]|jgi:predicted DNA-binding transcriptional regulator AlpA|nr:hypothetical protein [Gammaproteobacteria bacterium]
MQLNRIVRLKELKGLISLSEVTIWRKEKEGTFPRRKRIGKRAVGWDYRDVIEWMEAQKRVEV